MRPTDQLRERLKAMQAEKSEMRDRRAASRRISEQAKAEVAGLKVPMAKLTSSPQYKAALRAQDDLRALEAELEALDDAERGILAMLSDGQPRSGVNGPQGDATPPSNGWARAAGEFDLRAGRNRADMEAADLMRSPMASLTVTPSSDLTAPTVSVPFMQQAQDRRFLYPSFVRNPTDPSVMAISEYRQTGGRTVTGSVERDPIATTEKAKLALKVELETPTLKQFAGVIEEVPMKLFDVVPVLVAFLENELRYQIDLALDAHVLAQIAAATPAEGKTGATLIEQSRHGVAAMRGVGGNPTILALSPTDAADLDTQTSGADAAYIFATRDSGSASPLWGNTIIEVPDITAPMLIDPQLLGAVYGGRGTLLVDPYTGMDTNEVRVRVEIEALFHVRDIAGAYVIGE
jgi:hypothetical protein